MLPIRATTSTIVRMMNMKEALLAARDTVDVRSGDGECTRLCAIWGGMNRQGEFAGRFAGELANDGG
jgi:hypothetical protein